MYIENIEFRGKKYVGFELTRIKTEEGVTFAYREPFEVVLIKADFSTEKYSVNNKSWCGSLYIKIIVKVDGKKYEIPKLWDYLEMNLHLIYNMCRWRSPSLMFSDELDNRLFVLTPRNIDLEFRKILRIEPNTEKDYNGGGEIIHCADVCDTFILKENNYISLLDIWGMGRWLIVHRRNGETPTDIKITILDTEKHEALKKQAKGYLAKCKFLASNIKYYGRYYK